MKQPIRIQTALLHTRLRRYLPKAAATPQAGVRRCRQVLLVLAFLVLSQMAQAINPPPDGGYPGGNTAEGQNTLFSLSTGTFNTAVGWFSLKSNTEGNFNTAVGAGTLLANVGDQNTATGTGALLSNTTGIRNTANGAFALFSNTSGGDVFLGNTATGDQALFSNTLGGGNTGIGDQALFSNTTGNENTAVGNGALFSNTGDGDNTAIGYFALSNNSTGIGNIAIGIDAGINVTTANNVICIGAIGENASGGCYIADIFDEISSGGGAVFINSAGKLGTAVSSRRFKDDIKPIGQTSEAIFALKPVTFRYKKAVDPAGITQFGLVAEEVEKINPDLVVRDKEGKAYSVRYDQVNAMLLNEFLKEHKKVHQLEVAVSQQRDQFEAKISELKKEIGSVAGRSRHEHQEIQKAKAQTDMDKGTPRVRCE